MFQIQVSLDSKGEPILLGETEGNNGSKSGSVEILSDENVNRLIPRFISLCRDFVGKGKWDVLVNNKIIYFVMDEEGELARMAWGKGVFLYLLRNGIVYKYDSNSKLVGKVSSSVLPIDL